MGKRILRTGKTVKLLVIFFVSALGLTLFNNCSGGPNGFNTVNSGSGGAILASTGVTPPVVVPPVVTPPTGLPATDGPCQEGTSSGAYQPQSGPTDLITVDATVIARKVCPEFWGINHSPAWDPLWDSPASAAAIAPLNFTVGRYWGGSGGDWINWTNFPNNFGTDFPTPLTAWNVISKTGIKKLLIQTNPTTIGGNDPGAAPITQAVNYFKANNIPIFALEVGNEQDNSNAQDAVALPAYSQIFTTQCRAAKAVDSSFACMGPVSTNDWFWWPTNGGAGSPNTLENFLALQGNKNGTGLVDKISLHWYPGYDMNRAQGEFLQVWPLIQGAIKKYDTRNLPVYFTEFSASDAGAKTAWMGTAIEVADMMQVFKLYGVGGVDYFTIHQVANNWGFLRGGGEANPNSPSATYYALYLTQKMGAHVLNLTQGQDRTNMSAYATMDDKGHLQVMVINKGAQSQALRLAFKGYDPTGATITNAGLVGGSESQTNVQFNGAVMPSPTALPAAVTSVASGAVISVAVEPFTVRVFDIHK